MLPFKLCIFFIVFYTEAGTVGAYYTSYSLQSAFVQCKHHCFAFMHKKVVAASLLYMYVLINVEHNSIRTNLLKMVTSRKFGQYPFGARWNCETILLKNPLVAGDPYLSEKERNGGDHKKYCHFRGFKRNSQYSLSPVSIFGSRGVAVPPIW